MVQKILSKNDFQRILESYAGQLIKRIPITKTTSNTSGEETLTEGTPEMIKAYFMLTGQNWDYQKAGFIEKGDAVLLAKYEDGVKKNDLIVQETSGTCRIKEIYHVPGEFGMNSTAETKFIYSAANLFLSQ